MPTPRTSAAPLAAAFSVVLAPGGCDPRVLNALAAPSAPTSYQAPSYSSQKERAPSLFSSRTRLMLFGGERHDEYLGCLNCSEQARDSVHNEFGPHGSSYRQTSVLNSFSPYGSGFSQYSACNPFAREPPIIVDADGGFYGRLTLNENHRQQTRMEAALAWLLGVCEDH